MYLTYMLLVMQLPCILSYSSEPPNYYGMSAHLSEQLACMPYLSAHIAK